MKTAQRGIYAFDDFKHSRMYLAKYVKRVIKMILKIKKNIQLTLSKNYILDRFKELQQHR